MLYSKSKRDATLSFYALHSGSCSQRKTKINRLFSLVHFFLNTDNVMILRRFESFVLVIKRSTCRHEYLHVLFLMNKTKDQIS